MDSLTQIVLGASVGEAILGKKVGNKAPVWGAVGGTIPDLDIIPGKFLDTVGQLDIHRGFSHSLLFCLILAPAAGWLIHKIHQRSGVGWKAWAILMFWCLLTHAVLDCFTTWGTQLLWPLDYRIAWHSIFVIDPLYTLPFLVFLVFVLFTRRTQPLRRRLNHFGLGISSCYLMITLINKWQVNDRFEEAMAGQNIPYISYQTKPTPFNNLLWSCTAITQDRAYLGFYSLLDEPGPITFFTYPKQHELLDHWKDHPELQTLLKLTDDYYTVEQTDQGYVVNDLRFGQSTGFLEGKGDFVFAYEIDVDPSNPAQLSITQRENSFDGMEGFLWDIWERI